MRIAPIQRRGINPGKIVHCACESETSSFVALLILLQHCFPRSQQLPSRIRIKTISRVCKSLRLCGSRPVLFSDRSYAILVDYIPYYFESHVKLRASIHRNALYVSSYFEKIDNQSTAHSCELPFFWTTVPHPSWNAAFCMSKSISLCLLMNSSKSIEPIDSYFGLSRRYSDNYERKKQIDGLCTVSVAKTVA